MKKTPALTQIGAIAGLWYGISQRKPFWVTAGFTILFAVGGSVLGIAYDKITEQSTN